MLASAKRRAGAPLNEYEAKITGPNAYLWREGHGMDGQGNGVFITVPLNPPMRAGWEAGRAARNAANATRRAADSEWTHAQ